MLLNRCHNLPEYKPVLVLNSGREDILLMFSVLFKKGCK